MYYNSIVELKNCHRVPAVIGFPENRLEALLFANGNNAIRYWKYPYPVVETFISGFGQDGSIFIYALKKWKYQYPIIFLLK